MKLAILEINVIRYVEMEYLLRKNNVMFYLKIQIVLVVCNFVKAFAIHVQVIFAKNVKMVII